MSSKNTGMPRVFTPEEDALLRECAAQGLTAYKAERKTHIASAVVLKRRARELGIKFATVGEKAQPICHAEKRMKEIAPLDDMRECNTVEERNRAGSEALLAALQREHPEYMKARLHGVRFENSGA